ncbi:hypothetical protein [Oceanobacillus senegalensis]|uniref:hypothetical protein n=1 Tax=Oceanobacillus senegalensis TaxID=1936063 RepID=UPI001C4F55EA|nr:hypothetical protein [Oceanobacillus senegalensis]
MVGGEKENNSQPIDGLIALHWVNAHFIGYMYEAVSEVTLFEARSTRSTRGVLYEI